MAVIGEGKTYKKGSDDGDNKAQRFLKARQDRLGRRKTKESELSEAVQLDELSNKTLGGYIKKAVPEIGRHAYVRDKYAEQLRANPNKDSKDETADEKEYRGWMRTRYIHHDNKRFNREEGVRKAADRIIGEALAARRERLDEERSSLRLIKTHTAPGGRTEAKVYKDTEWGEHRVKFYHNGKHIARADYHTDDVQDAHDTAKHGLTGVFEDVNEAKTYEVHVRDTWNDESNLHPDDEKHVLAGVKTHGGSYAYGTDKGASFEFPTPHAAKAFASHVDRCPRRSCRADLQFNEGFDNWTFRMEVGDKAKVIHGDHVGVRGTVSKIHNDGESYTLDGKGQHHISTLTPIREERIDELSHETSLRYLNKAVTTIPGVAGAGERAWAANDMAGFKKSGTKLRSRVQGVKTAARNIRDKAWNDGFEVSADFAAHMRMNEGVQKLVEARRGRPPKNPAEGREPDEREHIMVQLRKAANLSGTKPIKFADGSSHTISADDAHRLVSHHDDQGPDDKAHFGNYVGKSHDNLRRTLSAMNEGAEQIDELSRGTLGSYIKKAASNMSHLAADAEYHSNQGSEYDQELGAENGRPTWANHSHNSDMATHHYGKARRASMKANKRSAGISQATDKLVKEERLPGAPRRKSGITAQIIAEEDRRRLERAIDIIKEMAFGDK